MRAKRQRMMIPLEFAPGVIKDSTVYSRTGFWSDTDKVRFRRVGGRHFVEKMGGWTKFTPEQFLGKVRSLHRYTSLVGDIITCIASNARYYVYDGAEMFDVTPIVREETLGTDPIATTSGSSIVTVTTPTPHNLAIGDEVILSGATTFNGVDAGAINVQATVVDIPTTTTFTFDTGDAASGTGSGGGASVEIQFILAVAAEDAPGGSGWGVTPWGEGGWGEPSEYSVNTLGKLPVWTQDNYGEDVIAARRGDGLYYLDITNLPDRMVPIADIPGATNVPSEVNLVTVSERDRHVIVFGAQPFAGGGIDPLLVRWSDQEDYANWTPGTTTTSGEIRLSRGTQIIGFRQTRQEILIWTDRALYTMRYIGGVYVFSVELLAEGVDIAGVFASTNFSDTVYWFGRGGFYQYDGRVTPIECPVQEWLFSNINWDQTEKISCGPLRNEGEIWWVYPSVGQTECDRYIVYNTRIGCWYVGSMDRTAWWDGPVGQYPLAASEDGWIYEHEVGWDDGSTLPPSPVNAWAQSSYIEIADGMDMMFVDELIPDATFEQTAAVATSMNITLRVKDWPGTDYNDEAVGVVYRSVEVPVEQFTARKAVRLRGRALSMRLSSEALGSAWRIGIPRIRARTDGER